MVTLRPDDIHLPEVRSAIPVSVLTEYGDIINAVVSDRIFRRIHECGVKVVLSGDGSDELFGGYEMFCAIGEDSRQRLFQHVVGSLHRTELQRVDRTSMRYGVEVRVPFLDLSVVRLALRVPFALKVRDGQDKWVLRQAFAVRRPRVRPQAPQASDVVLVGCP